jgi:hypothetical protein
MATVGLEIASYPNKLFYVLGVDDSLCLEGGYVYVLRRDAPTVEAYKLKGLEPFPIDVDSIHREVTHDIDFEREGVYTVTISTSGSHSVSFPVQVISQDEIRRIAELLD